MCHVLRSKLPDPQKRKNVLNMLKGIGNPPVGWEVMHSDQIASHESIHTLRQNMPIQYLDPAKHA